MTNTIQGKYFQNDPKDIMLYLTLYCIVFKEHFGIDLILHATNTTIN